MSPRPASAPIAPSMPSTGRRASAAAISAGAPCAAKTALIRFAAPRKAGGTTAFPPSCAAMGESIFAAGYQDKPYWWEAAPRPDLPPVAPPARADVAIVGSGYTGLTAAIELARGGRQ